MTLSLVGNIPRRTAKFFFVPMLKRMFTSQIRCSHGEHDVHQVNIAISFKKNSSIPKCDIIFHYSSSRIQEVTLANHNKFSILHFLPPPIFWAIKFKIKETGRAKWQKKVKLKSCLPPPAEAVTIYFSQIIKNKEVQEVMCMNFFIPPLIIVTIHTLVN